MVLPDQWAYILMIATTLASVSSSPALSHLSLNFVTNGIDPMDVAKAISVYGLVIFVAKLACGSSIDKLGVFKTMIIFGLIVVASMTLIWLSAYIDTVWFMYVACMSAGAGVAIQTLGYPNWCRELTSDENYSRWLKKSQMGYQMGALVGSLFPGIFYDYTGTYAWFYLFCAMLSAVSFYMVFTAFKIAQKYETDKT